MKRVLATMLVALLMMSAGCKKSNNNAVITVNDTPITQQEVDDIVNKQMSSPFFAQLDKNSEEAKLMVLIAKDKAINELIVKKLPIKDSLKKPIQKPIKNTTKSSPQNGKGNPKNESNKKTEDISKLNFNQNNQINYNNKLSQSEIKKIIEWINHADVKLNYSKVLTQIFTSKFKISPSLSYVEVIFPNFTVKI